MLCHDLSSFNEHLHQFVHTTVLTVHIITKYYRDADAMKDHMTKCFLYLLLTCMPKTPLKYTSHRKEAIKEKLLQTFNLAHVYQVADALKTMKDDDHVNV